MKRKATIVITAAVVTAATGTFAATKLHSSPTEGQDSPAVVASEVKQVNVETLRVEASSVTEHIVARGVTAAENDVTLSAEIPGRITYLGPAVGQKVKKGQILAKINIATISAQRRRAQANYALAEVTHRRLAKIGASVVSRQKLDEAEYTKSGARAQLAGIDADLRKGVIRSSLSGVVTARHVELSEFVNPGTPLYRVVAYRTIVVEAQLAETQVSQARVGSEVEVTIDALSRRFTGVVAAVLPTADPRSKTFTVRVEVQNPDLAILVGMSARLQIATRVHDKVVLVSQDSVLEGRNGRGVYVAVDGTARYRPVTLGAADGDRVTVLEGLKPGEQLVVLGQRYLSDGLPVRIAN
jgi:RND family efflux transporter MFP subunit